MPIELIHVSDIHFGSGESHGKVNPATGLNVRFEDFVAALTKVVDYALDRQVDIFLFSGDAYRTPSPEPLYQKYFARELKRLSDAGIKTVLVVGNHDQILRSQNSHSMSVFQSLAVPGILTVDRPLLTVLDTAHGKLQLIGLPHITRHQLMTLEKYSSLPAAALDRVLVEHITALLRGYYEELVPDVPAVVTAHMGVDSALAGIEQELLIGYTLSFPVEMFVDSRIDYVALGHIHKHQILRKAEPPILYAGSLERVDFGEANEDKGFVHATIDRGQTKYEFHSINPRPFVTVDVDLSKEENPMQKLERAIKKAIKPGCVLRIRYIVTEQQLAMIDEDLIFRLTAAALSTRLQADVVQKHSRSRMPQMTESVASSPLVALESYLADMEPERKQRLLAQARLLAGDSCSTCPAEQDNASN
jgi:exonuclease SbcD